MVSKKINIEGVVQGVGFRYFAAKKAKELKIKGTVQNLKDGSVLIFAEANEDLMKEFITWCHKGPLPSRVDACHLTEHEVKGHKDFTIIR